MNMIDFVDRLSFKQGVFCFSFLPNGGICYVYCVYIGVPPFRLVLIYHLIRPSHIHTRSQTRMRLLSPHVCVLGCHLIAESAISNCWYSFLCGSSGPFGARVPNIMNWILIVPSCSWTMSSTLRKIL